MLSDFEIPTQSMFFDFLQNGALNDFFSFILFTEKSFVLPTKSFVKIGITKYFVTTKCLVLSTKSLLAAAKFLVEATKILFVVPNFVAVTKPFFSVYFFFQLLFQNARGKQIMSTTTTLPLSFG